MSAAARPRKRHRRPGQSQAPVNLNLPKIDIPAIPSIEELNKLKVAELRERAEGLDLELRKSPIKKEILIEKIRSAIQSRADKAKAELDAARTAAEREAAEAAAAEEARKLAELSDVVGILDTLPEGYGFLRTSGYLSGPADVYVSASLIRRNKLRRGDLLTGKMAAPPRETEKYGALRELSTVNGMRPDTATERAKFAQLTPVYPDERLLMERGKPFFTARTIDLVAPIGKGQRGMIVSPPKAGKTEILKDVAASIHANNPEVH
ncbi:MAG: hypothetical protein LBJ07_01075, partial [Actinomycetes bacterium]|nr:hypothetical protein [Actinomycetes bacterium]